jgi:ATP-binding cassette subfamily B (MDR/TAP) protein 1
LRKLIGLVPQQPNLFFGTIADNIRMGDESITMDMIVAAAKLSNAHDFIMKMPQGYDTPAGQSGGELLSGGQIQRVAIARAIVRKPKILLLDEATSALDTESEKIVQHALENVMAHQTTIVIAHRLSTIRNADRILVFEKGVVVEDGPHDTLIQNLHGPYYNLVKAQEMTAEVHVAAAEDEKAEPMLIEPLKSPMRVENAAPLDEAPGNLVEEDREPSLSMSVNKAIKGIQDLVTDAELLAESAAGEAGEQAPAIKKPDVKRVFNLSRENWPYLFVACVAASFNGIVFPAFSIIVSRMITVFYLPDANDIQSQIAKYCFGFIGLAVGEVLANYFSRFFFSVVGERLTTKIRMLTMRSLLKQEIGFFDDTDHSVGVLCAKLSNDAGYIRGLTVDWSNQVVQGVTTIGVGVTLAFYFDWRITLFLLALAPLIFIAGAGQMAFLQGGENQTDEESSRIVGEAVGSVRAVKAFTLQEFTVGKFVVQLKKFAKVEGKNGSVFAFFFGLTQFILFFTFAASFWFTSIMIKNNKSNFNDAFQSFYVMVFTFMSIGELNSLSPDVQKAKDGAVSIFSLIDRKSAIDPMSGDGELVALEKSTLKFSNVHFSYPSRKEIPILQDLSLSFAPGKVIALVGPSGSGKSTIFSLLERFYDVDAGSVHVGDIDLRNVRLQELRKQIAIVSQDPVLFDLPIRDNINYGVKETSPELDKAIRDAAKKANILDLIEDLPEGLDTYVGRRGSKLSGGQRQRVAIARALLKDPKLLLLDEATSALDNESEKIIQESLSRLMEGRTTLVIAHRLSTIRNADEIVVMAEGKVIERGTHSELMAKEGLYSSLVHAGDATN